MEKRTIETRFTSEDAKIENSLRPRTLAEYIGQERIKENLQISIQAAKQRGESLDHILFYGPPGLGKTTISGIIANEMGVKMRVTSGPAIEKPGEMASVLNGLGEGDILFVDEIHRLNKQVEEVLLPWSVQQQGRVFYPLLCGTASGRFTGWNFIHRMSFAPLSKILRQDSMFPLNGREPMNLPEGAAGRPVSPTGSSKESVISPRSAETV